MVSIVKVRDGWDSRKNRDFIDMVEYGDGFADKKSTNRERYKEIYEVTCGMTVDSCTVNQSWCSSGIVSLRKICSDSRWKKMKWIIVIFQWFDQPCELFGLYLFYRYDKIFTISMVSICV